MDLEEATLKMLQESMKQNSNKSTKTNLKETTIKDMYNQLDNTKDVTDVEGLIDDILVVTDPEITSEEYDEVIDRAQEIIEDTPEGEIPFDEDYVGQYLLTCPICGTTFVSETMLEPGATCPACMEVPEGFVVKGQIQTDENVAIDNGLQADTEQKSDEDTSTDEVINTSTDEDTDEDTDDNTQKQVTSKELPQGNKLQETKLTEDHQLYYDDIQEMSDNERHKLWMTEHNKDFTDDDEFWDWAEEEFPMKEIEENKTVKTEEEEVESNGDTLPVSGNGIEVIVTENSVGYILRGLIIDNNNKQFQYVQGQSLPLGKYKRVSKNTVRNRIEQLQDDDYKEYKGKGSLPLDENKQYAKFERYQIRRIKENKETKYGIFDLLEQKYRQINNSYDLIKESLIKLNN